MAWKKSGLNSSLGQVSQDSIRFMTSAGKGMCTSVTTDEDGYLPSSIRIGFKQVSKAKTALPYQIEYRTRYKYTNANAKRKGANYSTPTGWKAALAVPARKFKSQSYPAVAKDALVRDDNHTNAWWWHRHNKKVNTSSSYVTFMRLYKRGSSDGTPLHVASGYAAKQYQVRIRTYNANTDKHGSWVNSAWLSVRRRPRIQNEAFWRMEDGGLCIEWNMKWDRGGKFHVESIKGKNEKTGKFTDELLKSPVSGAANIDQYRTAQSTPPLRSGWEPCYFEVPQSKLRREVASGEYIYVTGYFKAESGDGSVKTYLENSSYSDERIHRFRVKKPADVHKPVISLSADMTRGIVIAKVSKAAGDPDPSKVGCTVSYIMDGVKKTISPAFTKAGTGNVVKTLYIMPPIGCDISVKATFKRERHEGNSSRTVRTRFDSSQLYVNSTKRISLCASAWANMETDESCTANVSAIEVYGRELPVAVIADGRKRTVNIRATLVEPEFIREKRTFRGNGTKTAFSLGVKADVMRVTVNGTAKEYTETGSGFRLATAPANGSTVVCEYAPTDIGFKVGNGKANYEAWNAIMENPGAYVIRMRNGTVRKAVIPNVSFSRAGVRETVNIEAQEVS